MPDLLSMEKDYQLAEAGQLAEDLLSLSGDCRVWLLGGEPGTGKTTLIREVAVRLGVDRAAVSSPTFSIVNRYEGSACIIWHFDLYRIRSERELFDLGMDEYLESGDWCLIEWPGLLEQLHPTDYLSVQIRHPESESADHRHLVVTRVQAET